LYDLFLALQQVYHLVALGSPEFGREEVVLSLTMSFCPAIVQPSPLLAGFACVSQLLLPPAEGHSVFGNKSVISYPKTSQAFDALIHSGKPNCWLATLWAP